MSGRTDSLVFPAPQRVAARVREVYFVRAVTLGLIKIGVANFAAQRVMSLQTHSPDRLELMGVLICDDHGTLETALHLRFADLRSHGEWFRPGRDLVDFIAEYALGHADAGKDKLIIEHYLHLKDRDLAQRLRVAAWREMQAGAAYPRCLNFTPD
jgi:hypothetical protein